MAGPMQAAETEANRHMRTHPLSRLQPLWAHVQSCATSLVFGMSLWIFSLGHCLIYLVGPEPFGRLIEYATWVWATGSFLVLGTVLEILARVSAQGGPVWRWRSWRRMMIPLCHQLEALVLAIMIFRLGMSIYLLHVALQGGALPVSVSNLDKATVLILCVYRALRTWEKFRGISVQETLHERRKKASMKKLWMHEFKEAWQEHRARQVVRIQQVLNKKWVQMLFFVSSLTYCAVEFFAFVRTSEVLGYALLFALGAEFLLRAWAQGGEHFFRPSLNKMEFCVLAAGTWCLFYATWYTQYLVSSKNEATAFATATALLLLIHRCLRLLGIQLKISASEFDADSVASSLAVQAFMANLGCYVDVPPTNVKVDLSASSIHIQKASLKPETFEGLHLPLAVTGALVEDLFVDLSSDTKEMARLTFASRTHGRTRIRVKNLLLVLGPGPGLSSCPNKGGAHWHHQTVLAAKWRVVKMICQRLTVPVVDATAARESQDSLDSLGSSKSLQEMRRSLMRDVRQSITRMPYTEMHLRNISVQFEDPDSRLGYGCFLLGMKLDSLKLDWHQGRHCHAQLARWSLYAEPFAAADSSGVLLRSKPRKVAQDMVKLNSAERLRSWAFASMEDHRRNPLKQLRRMERFADRHNILTVQHVNIRGAPKEVPKERTGGLLSRMAARFGAFGKDGVTKSTDIESAAIASNPQLDWDWKAHVRPIRITVDDMQFRCLKNLQRCIGDWWIHDQAIQWHPGYRPCDPQVLETSKEQRSEILRSWWIYASHKALILEGRRPRFTYLNLVRRVEYRLKHRALISEVLRELPPLVPGRRITLKPAEHHCRDLALLQTHLPYSDIVTCLREELARSSAQGPLSRRPTTRPGATPTRPQQEENDDEDEEEEVVASGSSFVERSEATASGMVDQPQDEPSMDGHWELSWSALEVWILGSGFGNGRPRPILLYGELLEIGFEGEFRSIALGAPSRRLPPFGLLATLKDLAILSPYSGRACGGMGVDVVRILQPVKMSPDCLLPNFPWLGLSRMGEKFACILQASPSGKEVLLEMHLPDARILVWEPLALPLGHFLEDRSDEDVSAAFEAGGCISAWQAGPVESERREQKVHGRRHPLRVTLAVQSKPRAFIFPHQVEVQVLEGLQRGALRAHRQAGLLLPWEDVDLRVVLRVGALRVFQVSRLIGDTLGVEEARVDPHQLHLHLGAVARWDSPGFVKNFSVIVDPGRKTLFSRPWRAGDAHGPPFRGDDNDVELGQDELGLDGKEEEEHCGSWLANCCSSHAAHAKQSLAGLQPLRSMTSEILQLSEIPSKQSFCEVSFWAVKEREFNARFFLRVGDDWYHKVTAKPADLR